ncbi:GtrA family protein [Streptomyces lavendulocolor]|uniref:GtrA family protein n=1 Tax=Streptomyces lavendulocolor TaxID=67316 RepID=UPI0033E763A0
MGGSLQLSGRGSVTTPGARVRVLAPEAIGLAAVGIVAYGVDALLFVWLRGIAGYGPLVAKCLSFLAGCTVAYLGNVLGPYRRRATGGSRTRRYIIFFTVNAAGALIQLLCLGIPHYMPGFTRPDAGFTSGEASEWCWPRPCGSGALGPSCSAPVIDHQSRSLPFPFYAAS